MPVTFWFGRSGSGKTHSFAERIARACSEKPLGPPLIYLVPEQFTYQAEKALLAAGAVEGYCRAQVLSFTRLADWVYARAPAPRRPRLTTAHREILTTLLLARLRAEDPGSVFLRPGMEEPLAEFFAEAKRNATGADTLGQAAERFATAPEGSVSRRLAEKLRSLSRLYEDYGRAAAERFEDPGDSFLALSEHLPRLPALQGAEVFVDSFAGYTPVEERLLAALARRVVRLHVALMGDPGRMRLVLDGGAPRGHPAFRPLEETLTRLVRLFRNAEVEIEKPECLYEGRTPPRFLNRELAHVEAAFTDRSLGRLPAPAAVHFYEADTPRAEARKAAEIAAAWVAEKGWRPGGVGILTRNLDLYAEPLEDAFRTLRLPVFVDRALPLEAHPVVSGIRSLVRAAVQPHRTDLLIELGKSGLLAVPREDVDRLELHVREFPRAAREWYADKSWAPPAGRSPFDDNRDEAREPDPGVYHPSLDGTRRALAAPVQSLRRTLRMDERPEAGAGEFLAALVDCIDDVLAARPPEPHDERILEQAGQLFGQMRDAAAGETLPWELAAELVSRTLGHLGLPRIPPMLDQVFVGQVDRSRQPALRGVVLLGLSEGIFPAAGANTTLLNDDEREVLQDAGIDVRSSSRKLFEREWLFAYRAVSAASEELAIMRPRTNLEGAAAAPSPFWNELLRCFDAAPVQETGEDDEPDRCWRPRELAASAYRRVDATHLYGPDSVRRIKAGLFDDGRVREEVRLVEASARWRNTARLDPALLRDLYGGKFRISASQLRAFASCPFQHYTNYLLRPRETMEPAFERRDAGNYAHAFLQRFTALLRARRLLGEELDDATLDELFGEAIRGPHQAIMESGLADSQGGALLLERLTEELRGMARWLADSFVKLPFRPLREETVLGRQEGDSLSAIEFALPSGWEFTLTGQIDRLDSVLYKDQRWFLVVDYKLSGRGFSFPEWYGGQDLQLPLYMLAVKNARKVLGDGEVLGALYLAIVPKQEPVTDIREMRKYTGLLRASFARDVVLGRNWKSMDWVQGSPSNPLEKHRTWGTPVADEVLDELVTLTEQRIHAMAGEIISGRAAVEPARHRNHTACEYCNCKPVCGIDWQLNRARPVITKERREVLEELHPLGDGSA